MSLKNICSLIADHPLNKGARISAVSRFVRWQVASRLLREPIAMPFVENTSLLMETGMTGATGNWYCGLLELDEMAFALHALRPTDLFADIGANVGSYTILAAAVAGAKVVAVEPLPATYAKLLRNIAYNAVTEHVSAHCLGVSAQTGQLDFIASRDTMNRVALPDENASTIKVPVTTLDLLFAAQKPSFIKIDVEGHEKWVIEGGSTVLSSPQLQAIIIETNQSGAKFGVTDGELAARIASFGFTPHGYEPFTRTITAVPEHARNTIFLRDADAMQAVCRAAPRFKLVNGTI